MENHQKAHPNGSLGKKVIYYHCFSFLNNFLIIAL
jgi:hypothetical protein